MRTGAALVLNINGDMQQREQIGRLLHAAGCLSVAAGSTAELAQVLPRATFAAAVLRENLPDGRAQPLLQTTGNALRLLALDTPGAGWADVELHSPLTVGMLSASLGLLATDPGATASSSAASPTAPPIPSAGREWAHTLRNLLNPMRAGLALLARSPELGITAQEVVNRLTQQTLQLARLAETLSTPATGAATSATTASVPGPACPSPAARRRILIADDSPAVREAMAAMLSHRGHEVQLAEDGVQAVQQALGNIPDVVLLDLRMPGLDGFAAARQLRGACGASLRLVLMSGLTLDPVLRRHALAAGFDLCVDKVAPPEHWFSAIENPLPPA